MTGVGSNYLSHEPLSMSFAFFFILISLICCITTRNHDPICLRMCAIFSFVMVIASGYLVYQHASKVVLTTPDSPTYFSFRQSKFVFGSVSAPKTTSTRSLHLSADYKVSSTYNHSASPLFSVLNCLVSFIYALLCLRKSPKRAAYDKVKSEPEEQPVTIWI